MPPIHFDAVVRNLHQYSLPNVQSTMADTLFIPSDLIKLLLSKNSVGCVQDRSG